MWKIIPIDLSGQRFGRLIAIKSVTGDHNTSRKWICRCDCGNEVTVKTACLRRSHTKSCGCLHKDVVVIRNKLCKRRNINGEVAKNNL
jgi:hypothetical protein